MQMFDLRQPFFNPKWRRVAVTLFAGVWAVIEFATRTPFWGVLFGAVAAWCAWTFFVTWNGPFEDADDD